MIFSLASLASDSLASEIKRNPLLRFKGLEMRQAAEPTARQAADNVVCDLGVRVPDLDGLPTGARGRGVCQELDLAGFLERDEEVDSPLDGVSGDEDAVILSSRL